MPNPLQGVWLEARCNREAMPDRRVCDICLFSNLMGTVDEEIPQWLNMWGSKNINESVLTEDNMKVIRTSAAIAHMHGDKIGYNEKLVEENAAEKRKVVIRRKPVEPVMVPFIPQPLPYSFDECLKNPPEYVVRESMSEKKKVGPPKKKPIPLEFEAATIMKSHAACIGIHYVEADMEVLEVAEVIYKRVQKEEVKLDGRSLICYNDDGKYYECGMNGEIKGLIEVKNK